MCSLSLFEVMNRLILDLANNKDIFARISDSRQNFNDRLVNKL